MLISTAWAQDAAGSAGLGAQFFGFLPIILIFVIFYFLILKPQNDEAKKHAKMVAGLKKGDKVVTQGGIWGVITQVADDVVRVEISDGVEVNFSRNAVLRVLAEKDAKPLPKPVVSSKKR